MTLLTLNVLAFLFHTVLHLVDVAYQRIRQQRGTRKGCFQDIQTLTKYLLFDSWPHRKPVQPWDAPWEGLPIPLVVFDGTEQISLTARGDEIGEGDGLFAAAQGHGNSRQNLG